MLRVSGRGSYLALAVAGFNTPHVNFSRVLPALLLWVSILHPAEAQEVVPGKLKSPREKRILAKDLPDKVVWLEDTAGNVHERARQALLAGPDALENLAVELLKNELKDKDGRYTTPYFFREIAGGGDAIRGGNRRTYQKKVFGEWQKKYPKSKAAILAQARLHAELANDAQRIVNGVDVDGRKWKIIRHELESGMALLKKCSDLRLVDPAWTATYFAIVDQLGVDPEGIERETAALIGKFPDCGYVLARAIFYRIDSRDSDERETPALWLKRHLDTLPADTAAKLYARTYGAVINHRGIRRSRGFLPVDRQRLQQGLDLLAAEYPESVAMKSQDVALSCWVLEDRERAYAALLRTGDTLDLEFMLGNKASHVSAVSFVRSIPWVPEEAGIPVFSGFYSEFAPDHSDRMRKACTAGPAALEALITKIREEEPWDIHGNSNSIRFFSWFDVEAVDLASVEKRQSHVVLLERWQKEFPASPNAHLALARHWLSRAWEARGTTYAHLVEEIQWKGFREGLAECRKHLMAAKQLQEKEPAWTTLALTLIRGEGDPKGEFEGFTDVMFKFFPECPQTLSSALYAFRPKWGGEAGEWEPWIKEKTKALPEDVRARVYAQAVIVNGGYAFSDRGQKKEIYGSRKPDVKLLLKGVKSLEQKHPKSIRYPSAEAMIHAHLTSKPEAAYQAIRKLDGKVDLRVWYSYDYYERCVSWLTWKLLE